MKKPKVIDSDRAFELLSEFISKYDKDTLVEIALEYMTKDFTINTKDLELLLNSESEAAYWEFEDEIPKYKIIDSKAAEILYKRF